MRRWIAILAVLPVACCMIGCAQRLPGGSPAAAMGNPTSQPRKVSTVRCAVIGGMIETGFWEVVVARFGEQTGIHVEAVASGPKEELDKAFRRGGIDLITMHASDTIINIVADGLAEDPQPWLRNDMVLVGPPEDPAGIRNEADAGRAMKKIVESESHFVVHSSLGAQEVLKGILDDADVVMDPANTTILLEDRQRRVLGVAAQKKAYTLIGRIPFRNGKLPNDGLVVMVQGDPRLRRPYLVAVASPAQSPAGNIADARRFVAFLRQPETQAWIGAYGAGRLDPQSIFFPVTVRPTTRAEPQ